jgi:hypothetical protein
MNRWFYYVGVPPTKCEFTTLSNIELENKQLLLMW